MALTIESKALRAYYDAKANALYQGKSDAEAEAIASQIRQQVLASGDVGAANHTIANIGSVVSNTQPVAQTAPVAAGGTQQAAQPVTQPAQPAAQPAQQGVSAQMYFAANPELKAAFDSKNPAYVPAQFANDPQGFATWHYNTYGKTEGRPLSIDAPKAGALDPNAFATTNPQDGAVNPTNPIGKLIGVLDRDTYKAAEKYLNNTPNGTAADALKAAGLTEQQINALGASFTTQKVGDPKTPEERAKVEAAQAKLIAQIDPAAYASAAKQSRMTPEELVKNMTFDLARYGIEDMSQVGVSNVAGKTVYFDKATGNVLPERFGSDMSGKGGNYFELKEGPNGQAVPVPSWTDTSDKQDIATVVGAALAVAAPYAAPALAGSLGVTGAVGTGALYGGAAGAAVGGISGGAKGALTGGATGAVLGGLGGAASDYLGSTTATPNAPSLGSVTPNNTDWSPLLKAGMTSEQIAQATMFGNMGESQIASLLNQGMTGAQIAKLGMSDGWQPLLDRGMSSEEIAKATMFGNASEAEITRLLDAGFAPAQIAGMAEGGSLQSVINSSTGGAPQAPGGASAAGTAGGAPAAAAGTAGAGGALEAIGTAAGSPLGKAIIGAGVGSLLAPDKPSPPGSGGTGTPGSGSGGNTADLLNEQQGVAQQELDWLKGQYDFLRPYIQNQLDTGKAAGAKLMESADNLAGWGATQWQDYNSIYRPIEQKLASDAMNYDSEGNKAKAAARAVGAIDQQMKTTQQATNTRMSSMGINPASGRYAATQGVQDLYGAAQKASAATGARDQVEDKAISLRTNAANFGTAKAAMAGTLTNSANSTRSSAASTAGAGIPGAIQGANLPLPGYNAVANAVGNKINQNNFDTNAAFANYNAQMRDYQNELNGIGSLVGAALDTYGYYSSRP